MTTTAGYGQGVTYGRAVELKTRGQDWEVEGHVATYDRDLGDDVIVPGAFKKTLADGHRVRFLYSHDPTRVLGVPLELTEDGRKGVYGKFRISKTALGEDVRTLLLDGAVDSFSIGYVARDFEHDVKAGTRRLNEVELLECSVVAMPLNPQAVVTAAKAQKSLVAAYLQRHVAQLKAREYKLRLGRMSPEQVQAEVDAMRLRLALLTARS